MPFNYRFAHLCGAVYSRGNVQFTSDGNTLLSPVGNRVTAFDLVQHTSSTLPFEARTTIRAMALSPGHLHLQEDMIGNTQPMHSFETRLFAPQSPPLVRTVP